MFQMSGKCFFKNVWQECIISTSTPSCYSKIPENQNLTKIAKIVFSSLYEYVEENKPVLVHQSGFWSNDSCVNQLLSMFIQSF